MDWCRKFDCSKIVVGKLPGPCVGTLQGPSKRLICRNFAYASLKIYKRTPLVFIATSCSKLAFLLIFLDAASQEFFLLILPPPPPLPPSPAGSPPNPTPNPIPDGPPPAPPPPPLMRYSAAVQTLVRREEAEGGRGAQREVRPPWELTGEERPARDKNSAKTTMLCCSSIKRALGKGEILRLFPCKSEAAKFTLSEQVFSRRPATAFLPLLFLESIFLSHLATTSRN